jgi:hypothetical protein
MVIICLLNVFIIYNYKLKIKKYMEEEIENSENQIIMVPIG